MIVKIITIIIFYAQQGDRLPNVGQDSLRRGNVEGGTKSKETQGQDLSYPSLKDHTPSRHDHPTCW